MRYKKNYLTAVVLRVDFEPIAAFKSSERPELSHRIGAAFPKLIVKPMAHISFNMGSGGTSVNQEVVGFTYEHRKSDDPLPAVTLSNDFLSIDYGTSYEHFGVFADDVTHVYGAFAELHGEAVVKRIGLRYVNEITLEQGNALDWDDLIQTKLVASVKAGIPNGMKLARSMHQLQAFDEEATILMHYGLGNPDFPGELVRRQFILDIDAFRAGPLTAAQIVAVVRSLNSACEKIFESSIEAGLRQLMEVIND